MYKVPVDAYRKLLHDNITSAYEKSSPSTEERINKEGKKIAEKLDLDSRIEQLAPKEAYITLKDHKDDFANNPKCRLINPAKSELGIVSKKYLERINQEVRKVADVQQWRST